MPSWAICKHPSGFHQFCFKLLLSFSIPPWILFWDHCVLLVTNRNFSQAVFCWGAPCWLSRLPSGFLLSSLRATLSSSLKSTHRCLPAELGFALATFQIPLSLAKPPIVFKLAWSFLPALFTFPSRFFQSFCKLPPISIACPCSLLQTCFQLALKGSLEGAWSRPDAWLEHEALCLALHA